MKILLVEDDKELADTTRWILEKNKIVVDVAESLLLAKAAILDHEYSVVLLDRRLPDGDGTELIRHAKQQGVETRFVVVSAVGDLGSRVEGLDLGADDYLVKPYEVDELLARIRAVERRPLPDGDRVYELGKVRFNQDTRNFRISGEILVLSRREMLVLESLISGAGRVIARESLQAHVYGYDDEVQPNALEAHVSRLRKTLATKNSGVKIHTIRGVGYMLKEDG